MRGARLATLAAFFLMGVASAAEPPRAHRPAEPPPGTRGTGGGDGAGTDEGDHPPDESKPESAPEEASWIDTSHALVQRGLGDLALRVDDFFGNERRLDFERPGTFVRWRNELRSSEDRRLAYGTSFRLRFELPAARAWLSQAQVVFAGDTAAPAGGQAGEEEGGSAGGGPPRPSPRLAVDRAALELKLDLLRREGTVIDIGPGVWARLPSGAYLRARLRQALRPGLGFAVRLEPSVFWESSAGLGTGGAISVDRPLGSSTLVRWTGSGVLSEVSRGVEWGTEGGVVREIAQLRAAAYLAGAATGVTRPGVEVTLYRVFLRLRRSLWRHWLFTELEPEAGWPLDPIRGRHRDLAFTVRLEVQFAGWAPAAGGPPFL